MAMLSEEEIEKNIQRSYSRLLRRIRGERRLVNYFEENLHFPFKATAQHKKRDGSVEVQEVEITGIASKGEDFVGKDFNLQMQSGEYIFPVAYSQLNNIRATPETLEAFTVWDYWVRK